LASSEGNPSRSPGGVRSRSLFAEASHHSCFWNFRSEDTKAHSIDLSQEGGAMLTVQQTFNRPLECVWGPSATGLKCLWVERANAAQTERLREDGASDKDRKVA
jgi:hypothetical protein